MSPSVSTNWTFLIVQRVIIFLHIFLNVNNNTIKLKISLSWKQALSYSLNPLPNSYFPNAFRFTESRYDYLFIINESSQPLFFLSQNFDESPIYEKENTDGFFLQVIQRS